MMQTEINKLNLHVLPSESPKYQVIELQGEFDSYSLQAHKESILQLVQDFNKDILVFNFENLEFINSESISFFLQIHDLLDKKQKKLVIIHARPNVKDILDVIGLFETVPYYSTLLDFLKKI